MIKIVIHKKKYRYSFFESVRHTQANFYELHPTVKIQNADAYII